MTVPHTPVRTATLRDRFRLPDIPERHPDDRTSVDNLHRYGAIANMIHYLGSPETTIVSAEHYVVPGPAYVHGESRFPDLLVAFNAAPALYEASNGYIVSEQGKPPDFILEVVSRQTAQDDMVAKKNYYERLGVGEYWLFDRTGEFYGFTLAGYRLEAGQYRPIEVHAPDSGVLQGHSRVLGLDLRAETGYLGWHDPRTGAHIPTLMSEAARAADAEAARADAEARVRELEEQIQRLNA